MDGKQAVLYTSLAAVAGGGSSVIAPKFLPDNWYVDTQKSIQLEQQILTELRDISETLRTMQLEQVKHFASRPKWHKPEL